MIVPLDGPPGPARGTGIKVDHVGVVVRNLAAEVAGWRSQGFLVSDPVALMGSDPKGQSIPLGQSSARVVFSNGYVELSSPHPGVGNHLEPYLARGEGVRILVLAAVAAAAARDTLKARWPDISPVRTASRVVMVQGLERAADFRWFPLPVDVVPGLLSAVVEHLTPESVFHPSLVRHPNGFTRMSRVVATGNAADFSPVPALGDGSSDAPVLFVAEAAGDLQVDHLGFVGPQLDERIFRVTAR